MYHNKGMRACPKFPRYEGTETSQDHNRHRPQTAGIPFPNQTSPFRPRVRSKNDSAPARQRFDCAVGRWQCGLWRCGSVLSWNSRLTAALKTITSRKDEAVSRSYFSVYFNRLDTGGSGPHEKSAGQMEEATEDGAHKQVLDTSLEGKLTRFFRFLSGNSMTCCENASLLTLGELLNTELTISLVIRLDLTTVRKFLRYSMGTIYNCHSFIVKNKARISREDFEIRLIFIR